MIAYVQALLIHPLSAGNHTIATRYYYQAVVHTFF
jgi:hypothetical protein